MQNENVENMEKENDVTEEVETLFKTMTIKNLKKYESQVRNDIESKKQELRIMVGERYRDLIDAADSIMEMQSSAKNINEKFNTLQEYSNISNLKNKIKIQNEEGVDKAFEEKKKLIYPIAAEIKLLVDTPEQIWNALENHKYLKAACLYMIAKLVYKHLQSSEEAKHLQIMNTFPIIQKQWIAVSQFRSNILEKSISYLKFVYQNKNSVAETLCAVMLLHNVSINDALKIFLEKRRQGIMEFLSSYKTISTTLSEHLCELIKMIKITLAHIEQTFIPDETTNISLLEIYLRDLQKGLQKSDNENERNVYQKSQFIIGLYSEKTNIHIIYRYLPEIIQKYAPLFHSQLNKQSNDKYDQAYFNDIYNNWINQLVQEIQKECQILLQQISSGENISNIRKNIVCLLNKDEVNCNGNILKKENVINMDESGEEQLNNIIKLNNDWNNTCNKLINRNYSIWDTIFRELINSRIKEIINLMFDKCVQNFKEKLKDYIKKINNKNNYEKEIGTYIWDTEKLINMNIDTENLVDRTTSYLPLIKSVYEEFDKNLLDIKNDLNSIIIFDSKKLHEVIDKLVFEHGKLINLTENEKDRWGFKKDTEIFIKTSQDLIMTSIYKLNDEIKSILNDYSEQYNKNPKENKGLINQSIFLGKIAGGLLDNSQYLKLMLQNYSNINNISINNDTSNNYEQYQNICKLMNQTKLESYNLWINWIISKFNKKMSISINNEDWNNVTKFKNLWEVNKHNKNTGDDVVLPTQMSSYILESLFIVCKEMNKINGCFINKDLTSKVLNQLAANIIKLYNEFIDNYSMDNISEEGKLQLYSDMRFFVKVFEGYWLKYKQDEQNNLFKQLIRKIISSIDPINFTFFEKNINSNIDSHYYRVNILLGILLIFNQTTKERSNINIEHFNTISLAPQCQRFSIFPVINMSNNENFNEKNNIIIGSDFKSQQKNSGTGSKNRSTKERPKIQILKNITTNNINNEDSSNKKSQNSSTTNSASNLISTLTSSVTDSANSWTQSFTSGILGWASPDITRRTFNKK
ncbi:hypothetical protein BCR32DRAFT_291026 [Anaeromyces robustus]|uniref:Conserved oligomeric Golgi complex subunit 1 n=1 Tax=Anaeromyces robustus TaxID=1754192 RepID=A0A1Y1XHX6_9FUNG|nr:hypothetical protein BCR32DRAFT_291026 [Anaeromyces robustus]|eukprot:ORX84964.1 hypothetical protein BCR32DRAFT_291026 [Anaeromyces robustus]